MANNGPTFGQSARGEVRQTAPGAFSEGPNARLQAEFEVFLKEIPLDSRFVGMPFGCVSFDRIHSNRFGLEEIITIPVAVSPGGSFRLIAFVETAA